MGAFRTQIEALGAVQFYDGSDNYYSPGSGYNFVRKTFGTGSREIRVTGYSAQPSLVKTETNPHVPGGFFFSDMRGLWKMAENDASAIDEGTLTFTARFERDSSIGPPFISPDVVTDVGTAFEANTGDQAYSNGFFQVTYRSSDISVGFWDLHVTENDTIGIATFSTKGWGDLRVDYPNPTTQDRWGRRKCYTFDTGFPAGELFDGRPHLVTIRFRAHNQQNPSNFPALAQDNWIKLNIDGTALGATSRGPALTGNDGIANTSGGTHAFDELALWGRHISDAEAASMWGPAVWGADDWPYLGSGFTSAYTKSQSNDALLRIVDWEWQLGGAPRLPQVLSLDINTTGIDPVWEQGWADEIATAVGFDGTHRAGMGEATWDVDPWSSSLDQQGADKWLTDQDVALLGAGAHGYATATGDLSSVEGQLVGVASGHSSASASLSILIQLAAEPIAGSSDVYAITVGDLSSIVGSSDGSSTVDGDLAVGEIEHLAGASAGTSAAAGSLGVKIYSLIEGVEVDDNGMPIPTGGGIRRGRFTPKSAGLVNNGSLVGS